VKLTCMHVEVTMRGSVIPHYAVFLRCQQGQFYISVVEDAYFVKTVLYR
jgi:hypothetical protein